MNPVVSRYLKRALLFLITPVVLLQELLVFVFQELVIWLRRFHIVQAFGRWVEHQNRHLIVLMFLTFLGIALFMEFIGAPWLYVEYGLVWAIVIGSPLKLIFGTLSAQVFSSGHEKMMTIGWFKRLYDGWTWIKKTIHELLIPFRFYQWIMEKALLIKEKWPIIKQKAKDLLVHLKNSLTSRRGWYMRQRLVIRRLIKKKLWPPFEGTTLCLGFLGKDGWKLFTIIIYK